MIVRALLVLLLFAAPPAWSEAALDPLVIETSSGQHAFSIEVARTPEQRRTGLMHRTDIPADGGMLFDFRGRKSVAMWMKNTPTSLDMLFLSRHGAVLGVARSTVPFSTEIIAAPAHTEAVLELVAGTAEAIDLAIGDRVRHTLFTEP